MKWFKRIVLFLLMMFLMFLPTILFKTDRAFYDSLKGPKLPSFVFIIVWTIVDICFSIFFVFHIENKKKYPKKNFRRTAIFFVLTYIVYFLFPYFFFVKQSLFYGYIFTLSNLLFVSLTLLESLLLNKKSSLLLLPYVIWTSIASVLSILLYLNN